MEAVTVDAGRHDPEVVLAEVERGRSALRDAVANALRPYGRLAATTAEVCNCADQVWGIEITPVATNAAPAYVVHPDEGDEVIVGFGNTDVVLWNEDVDALAEQVRGLLDAVFAGRVVEVGTPARSRAKLTLAHGAVWNVGAVQFGLPWRRRQRRTYQPYTAPTQPRPSTE